MVGTINNYECIQTLGTGASCKVKLAIDKNTNRKVAVKIMNDSMSPEMKKLVLTEVNAMKNLDHTHVIKQIETGSAEYKKKKGDSKQVSYIVLELAQGGELFDYIANTGAFSEPVARYFFNQLLSGLDHCHMSGFAHRDLKPENLLMDN